MGDLKISMGSGSFGVDDALGNALAIEVGKLIDQMEVRSHDRAPLSSSNTVLVVVDWLPSRCGQDVCHFID
jgi:hypothetical protein